MFDTLKKTFGPMPDYPARTWELGVMRAVLKGEIYKKLDYEFHQERGDNGEYIPLARRRPSVRYNMCRLLVQDSTSLLFGEGRFPSLKGPDVKTMQVFQDLIVETGLDEVMMDAAMRGSVGSVAILFRVLKSRPFFDVMDTDYLTPLWRADEPDTLAKVVERYKVPGSDLAAMGYSIADVDMAAMFWFHREWDDQEEIWMTPYRVNPTTSAPSPGPVRDEAKTVAHKLGFVPIVWIKNLPGGDDPDGCCSFRPAVESQIEIEYILSQNGRGLKYSADPTLLIKEPAGDTGAPIVRSAAQALVVSKDGDAKLLEIGGTASEAVLGYVKTLREMALETIHGNRSSADKVNAAQSGRALEMLHQSLIWLADKLRTSYGTRGLLPLLKMVVMARSVMPIKVDGEEIPVFPAKMKIQLDWPPWFHRTTADMLSDANRLSVLRKNGMISRRQAVVVVKEDNAVVDVDAEVKAILADEKAAAKAAAAAGAKTTATEVLDT